MPFPAFSRRKWWILGFILLCALAAFFLLCLSLPQSGVGSALVLALVLALAAAGTFAGLYRLGLGHTLPEAALLLGGACLLLLLRLALFSYETLDYQDFLHPWVEFYRQSGGFAAMGQPVGNYNIPYLFVLALFSYLPIRDLYLIKLFSVLFDLLLALALTGLVSLFAGKRAQLVCFLVTLALPTVVLNGALWGQCDAVYASLALLALYLVLSDRPMAGMVAAGFSFAFKLQAIFLLPVFLLCLFAGKLKVRHLPLFPVSYAVAVSPAIFAGRPVGETLLLYFTQADTAGSGLNYNSPSVYSLFDRVQNEAQAAQLGIFAALGLCVVLFVVGFVFRRRLTTRALFAAALLFVVGIPLFLPHMHDRYFFLADVMTLALAASCPVYTFTVPLASFASLLGYHAYLKMRYLYPMAYGCRALLLVLLALAVHFCLALREPPDAEDV